MKLLLEKDLWEDWEGIDYEGYTIEFDRDSLERAIEDAQEEGHLTYDYTFHIKNEDGKEVATANSLKEARAWIDSHAVGDLIDYLKKPHDYDWDESYDDWNCFATINIEKDDKLQRIYKLLGIEEIHSSVGYDWLDNSDAKVVSKENDNTVWIEISGDKYKCSSDEFDFYKKYDNGTWYTANVSVVEVKYVDGTESEIVVMADEPDRVHYDYGEGVGWFSINEVLPWDMWVDRYIDKFLIKGLQQL